MKRPEIRDRYGKKLETPYDRIKGFFSRFWPALIIPAIVLVLWGVSAIVDSVHESLVENRVEIQYDGVTPYEGAYGPNMVNAQNMVHVRASSDRDAIVIVRDRMMDKVVGHFYVKAGEEGFVLVPDGVFNVFFYQGRGWDSNKKMKSSRGDVIKGGFRYDEVFGQDPKDLTFGNSDYNQISYDLRKRRYGNMHEKRINPKKMF